MKVNFFAAFLFSFFIIGGCKEKDDVDNTPKFTLELTVWDATEATPSNPRAEISPNASVSIFTTKEDADNNNPKYTGSTNASGVFIISVPLQQHLYVTAKNGNAKGTKNGFLIAGVFETEEQVNNSAAQSPASQIGDLILEDVNYDGVVDYIDKIDYKTILGLRTNTTMVKQNIFISE